MIIKQCVNLSGLRIVLFYHSWYINMVNLMGQNARVGWNGEGK